MKKIKIQNIDVAITVKNTEDFISITDMLKAKDGDFFVSDWLRNRNTVEFLGIWESIHNPNFNYGEFATIKSSVGLNNYKISVKEWTEKTKAIGLIAQAGRYGGTFAHKDIAFEFATWISPKFKLYLITEFQRLKTEENERLVLGWDAKRALTKINYKIHTDSIKENIIIPNKISTQMTNAIYASEADVLNVALFGVTAKEWKSKNKGKAGNIRDYSNVTQLVVLANLETLNSEFIKQSLTQRERLIRLNEIAISQIKSLTNNGTIKKLENAKNLPKVE